MEQTSKDDNLHFGVTGFALPEGQLDRNFDY